MLVHQLFFCEADGPSENTPRQFVIKFQPSAYDVSTEQN
ncbi:hypothetical protein JMJ77_0012527, partial [Colletotrichum scovillei]